MIVSDYKRSSKVLLNGALNLLKYNRKENTMAVLTRIGKAFVVGCGAGLVGQIIVSLFAGFLPGDLLVPISMLVFAVISVIVISCGFYGKIAFFGGDGAAIPLCGLMFGAATNRLSAEKNGASAGAAFFKGFLSVMIIILIGCGIAFLTGIFIH